MGIVNCTEVGLGMGVLVLLGVLVVGVCDDHGLPFLGNFIKTLGRGVAPGLLVETVWLGFVLDVFNRRAEHVDNRLERVVRCEISRKESLG